MSVKVAILTQPLNINFGGTLQAFALQKKLMDIGADVETINYRMKKVSSLRKILSTFKQKILNNKNVYYFFESEFQKIQINHKRFIESNMSYSKAIYTEGQLKSYFNERDFDVVIVGSDQVWRVAYSPKIENYFLDFLCNNKNIKKNSYAASFGLDEWQFNVEETKKIKEWLFEFENISVRESGGVELCKKYLDIAVKQVLDPTLLLSKCEYLDLCVELSDVDNKGKIFTYILDDSIEKNKIINIFSDKLERETFNSQPIKKTKQNFIIDDIESYIYPSIETWLKSFEDAEFIITDSFHGTVFSIIFNKPFISIINKERGSSRFYSLLKMLNLESRLITNHLDIDESMFDIKIDYNEINLKLEELRKMSVKYLANCVSV